MDRLRLGVIGCGARTKGLIKDLFMPHIPRITVTALCDAFADRAEKLKEICDAFYKHDTFCTTDWREVLDKNKVDAVLVVSGWETHIPVVIAALRAGIPAATEVGGAYTIQQCWDLVHTVEETGTKFMFLENCCWGRTEMLCMNMAHMGLFGEIMHCTGAYLHDLRREISNGIENHHYRLRNHVGRNCDNYPTHDLGPICKLLGINKNNKLLTLTSMASEARGINTFALAEGGIYEPLQYQRVAQGDIVNTNIKCAGGQTISLTFGTTLPLPYTRDFGVYGTKGCYTNRNRSIFLLTDHTSRDGDEWQPNWGNEDKYSEKYDHPVWKRFLSDGVVGGHGGMDGLTYNAMVDYVTDLIPCPIDVYDAATWMSVSVLSEQSAAMGGTPVGIPDFTNGGWMFGLGKELPLFGE